MSGKIEYPSIRRDENHIDSYHGKNVADPYFWLEDPDSEETKKFVEQQNAISNEYLNGCSVKEKFSERLLRTITIFMIIFLVCS